MEHAKGQAGNFGKAHGGRGQAALQTLPLLSTAVATTRIAAYDNRRAHNHHPALASRPPADVYVHARLSANPVTQQLIFSDYRSTFLGLLPEFFEPFSAVFDRLIEVNFLGEGRTTLKSSGRAAPRLTNVLGGAGRGKFVIHLR